MSQGTATKYLQGKGQPTKGGLAPGTNSGPPKEDSSAKKQQHIALY